MAQPLQRRLPGVRFDVPAPPLDEALPRMDIALFVGFAASGPLRVPVAVESLAEFETVFGGPLALLPGTGDESVGGLLHPAMRAFFANGGRRAWVQRVAGEAITTLVPLPAALQLRRDAAGAPWQARPAWLQARSPGQWADRLSLASLVLVDAVTVRPARMDAGALLLQASGPAAQALAADDSLRVPVAPGLWLQGRVDSVSSEAPSSDGRARRAVTLRGLCTMQALAPGAVVDAIVWFEPAPEGDGVAQRTAPATGTWLADGRLSLSCLLPASFRLAPGEVVRLGLADGLPDVWLLLDDVQAPALGLDGTEVDVRLAGRAWQVPAVPSMAPVEGWIGVGAETTALRLRLSLDAAVAADAAEAAVQHSGPLALVPRRDGAANAFALPDDDGFYAALARTAPAERAVQAFELAPPGTATGHAERFPLASRPATGELTLLPLLHAGGVGAPLAARPPALPALRRDGLEHWDWTLFAEPSLAAVHADALADRAESLRLTGSRPLPLRGVHAAFGAAVDGPGEEPTLLLVPDAVLPQWQPRRAPGPARIDHPADTPPAAEAAVGFDDCARTPLAAPQFLRDADPDAEGRFLLRWTAPERDLQYRLEESADAGFALALPAYEGGDTRLAVTGKGAGTLHYRVRAQQGGRISAWSGRLEVRVGGSAYERLPWSPRQLLALQRLMLRTAAGRGDMLAVLALPRHHRWPDALSHAEALRSATLAAGPAGDPPPLAVDEGRALSHGALFHPWVVTRREERVIETPPDGPMAGQLAAGALERGAWRAVAERPLRDVVALTLPVTDAERQALLEAQVNPLRAAPRGFVAGSSETLLADADWRPVNVRRLMSLLRRAALRRGTHYVFEPHGDVLRRTVERAFEAMLGELFRRGAFSGRSAAEAFRIEFGTPAQVRLQRDAGEFHVDLKVAPALPLTFLTVRLARSGERLTSQELR